MGTFGDIIINGKAYRIDLNSYKEKDLADFSPRTSVPGGSVNMGELLLYQPANITDWRHGFGFLWHTDAMGYLTSNGAIDTRQPGMVTLGNKPEAHTDSATTDHIKNCFAYFNGAIYASSKTASFGVRKFASGSWTDIYSGATNFILATETYLFVCPDGARIKKVSTAGAVTDTGSANATDYKFLCIHNGRIWGYQEGSNLLHWSSAESNDLSDLEGDADSDPAAVTVGAGGYPIMGMISYANYLYVFRADGVWAIGDDDIARRVLDYSAETNKSTNFNAYAVFNGYLYFNVGSKFYQYNGSRITDVTPPRMSDKFPYSEIRYYINAITAGNCLYVLAYWYDNSSSVYRLSWFSFDGVGWHKLYDFNTNATGYVYTLANTKYTLGVDPYTNKIYIDAGTRTGVTGDTGVHAYVYPWNNVPSNPFPISLDSDTAPYLNTSRLDMGFRRITKSSPSILVEADNCSTDRFLKIEYYIDGNSTDIESFGYVTSNGVTELTPNQQELSSDRAPTQEFRNMVITTKFINASTDNAQTPILEGLTLRFLMRPDVFYGYNFNIVAALNYVYGDTLDDRSPREIRNELLAVRDTKAPVLYTDIYGDDHYIYISSVSLQAVERHEEGTEDGTPNIESVVNVNVVEAE